MGEGEPIGRLVVNPAVSSISARNKAAVGLALWALAASGAATPLHLKLLPPAGYLPDLPALVRIEVLDSSEQRDWTLWDAEATLSSDSPGINLSTNRVILRNGLGSALVSFSGGADFNLIATLGNLQTNRALQT